MTPAQLDRLGRDQLDVLAERQKRNSKAFPFQTVGDFEPATNSKRHLIKGLLARGETSAWIAPPGGLKSALLASASVAVASGENWHGLKNKGRAGVLYFALERADLVRRRLQAHHERDGHRNLPIAVVSSIVNLMRPETVQAVVATIEDVGVCFNLAVGLVIFDTFAKLIAAGGGDENLARDQGAVFANIQRIKQLAPDIHVALIGHTGKDEARGARGSNAILGDADVMVAMSGEDVRTATITKANDRPEGPLFSFRSEVHEFGVDEDGDRISVNIVSDEACDVPLRRDAKAKLPKTASIALRALSEAVLDYGQPAPRSAGLPPTMKIVTAEQWRQESYRRGISASDEPEAKRKAFRRASEFLIGANRVGYLDEMVWPV